MNFESLLKKTADQITDEVKELQLRQDEEMRLVGQRLDELSREVKRGGAAPESKTVPHVERLLKSAAHEIAATPAEAVRRHPRLRIALEGGFFPHLSQKTTITSGTVGSSTPGILVPDRVLDVVPAARRRLTIRDVIPAQMTSASKVEFPKENAFTNAASPQVEASAKDESALTFTIDSAPVITLAHWIPATRQVLDDWDALGAFIGGTMLYGLKLKEEQEIISGDGTGQHLNGLVTQATAYADTYNAAGDTDLDTLRHAILEAEDHDELVDFIVLNPVDYHDIELIKDAASNVGNYVIGDPVSGQPMNIRTLWGRRVIVTNSMTSGSFLVGNSDAARIFDRQEAVVDISTEHDTYFTKNMVAIRVEERLALAVYRAGAFIYGTF